MKLKSYTLIEVMLAITILAILSTAVVIIINPADLIKRSQYTQAVSELREIGKAIQLYAYDHNEFPPDVSRDLPAGIEDYLTPVTTWPEGPLEGAVYDYDNWSGQTCIDAEASGSVQVTLRQVPDRNPDGTNVWAWYYVLQGTGTPHCSNSNEWDKGECVNCPGFDI